MNFTTFMKCVPGFYRSGTALEIVSGPGGGKSSVMEQSAALMSRILGKPFGLTTEILSTAEHFDIRGYLLPMKSVNDAGHIEARYTRPSIFPKVFNTKVFVGGVHMPDYHEVPENGILFLDEYGQSGVETQKVSAPLILSRCIGEHALPAGWRVWAASNRMSDKAGVVKRLSIIQNRAKTINIALEYAPFETWANRVGLHPLAITFAKRFPATVFRDSVPALPGPFCTPRSLVLCTQDLIAEQDPEFATSKLPDDEIAAEVAAAWMGEAAALEFIQHIRIGNELPTHEAIVKDPKGCVVPDRVEARFIMANMLAHHTVPENVSPIMTYVRRLDMEMQVLYVTAIASRSAGLLRNTGVVEWIASNSELLTAAQAG